MNSINKLDGPSYLFHKKPRKLIFLLHGYGDYADNFIPLAEYLNDKFIEGNFFAPNDHFPVNEKNDESNLLKLIKALSLPQNFAQVAH